MKRMMAILAFACIATASFAQKASDYYLGVTAGYYLPTGSTLRDAFGSQIFSLGLTPVSSSRPSSGSVTPSFNVIGADKDGNRFLLVPVTLGYEYHFSSDDASSSFMPFARVEGGVSYYSYNINNDSGSRFGYVADAGLGVSINKTIQLSAKYYLFQKESGIDFGGFQLGVTFGLIRL